jgi:nucleotide-binding universal stress UspA family protein
MRVLVATDLSGGADAAVREAATITSPSDALGIVHVVTAVTRGRHVDARGAELASARLREAATVGVREQAEQAAKGRAVELFVEAGIDHAEILRRAESWGAELLVVGSHGLSGLGRALGHVAERTMRYAHCDVLVARAASARGWVIAATDLSEPSFPAILAGADQARRRGARLEVVHAVGLLEAEASYVVELSTPALPLSGQDADAPSQLLSHALSQLDVGDAEGKIIERPAATAIVDEAEALNAELIVLGSRGRTGLSRIMLGSIAEKVVRAAHCSVLLATPRAARAARA